MSGHLQGGYLWKRHVPRRPSRPQLMRESLDGCADRIPDKEHVTRMAGSESRLAMGGALLWFRLRDLFVPPVSKVGKVGLKLGQSVLDYGCGVGGHSVAAAQAVGERGIVYAADIHPRALRAVRQAAARRSIHNIRPIETDCATGLEDASVDAVLLYDIYHCLDGAECVLLELHRVLKAGGVLSVSDHHMSQEQILAGVTQGGLFHLVRKARRSLLFEAVAEQRSGSAQPAD